MGENSDGDTNDGDDHLVENDEDGDGKSEGDDNLVENDGEGVANTATGATKHKRKGLVVTGKEG